MVHLSTPLAPIQTANANQLAQTLHDGKARPHASALIATRIVQLVKLFEDLAVLVLWYALAATGGDATSNSSATSDGDNHSVSALGNAFAGSGGSVDGFQFGLPDNGMGIAGTGGNPVSNSYGAALANSLINVEDFAAGGDGGPINGPSGNGRQITNIGDGASVSLIDKVDGNTTGSLDIEQSSYGDSAGRSTGGLTGTAGTAYSELNKTTASAAALTLKSTAWGGGARASTTATGLGGIRTSLRRHRRLGIQRSQQRRQRRGFRLVAPNARR